MSSSSSSSSHHVIESLTIASGVHFRDVTFRFDPRLTCIIGGRGAGKSAVLHDIRFGVGAKIPDSYADEHDACIHDTLGSGRVVPAAPSTACLTTLR